MESVEGERQKPRLQEYKSVFPLATGISGSLKLAFLQHDQ